MDSIWGIDKIRLSVVASEHCQTYPDNVQVDRSPWDGLRTSTPSDGVRTRTLYVKAVPVGRGSVFVQLREVFQPEVRWWLALEWNPSRQLYGRDFDLATVEDLPAAVAEVQEAVAHLVTVPDWSVAKVTRLDVTRDFWTVQAPMLLGAFAGTGDRAIRGPKTGAVESVYWNGPKGNHVIAYDKTAERGLEVVQGMPRWLRTEVVARRTWLQRAGITSLDSVTATTVDALGRPNWEATRMGEELTITTKDDLLDAVRALGLSTQALLPFIGWLSLKDCADCPQLSSATMARYRKLLRQLGTISPQAFDELRGSTKVVYRLDLESGTVKSRQVA